MPSSTLSSLSTFPLFLFFQFFLILTFFLYFKSILFYFRTFYFILSISGAERPLCLTFSAFCSRRFLCSDLFFFRFNLRLYSEFFLNLYFILDLEVFQKRFRQRKSALSPKSSPKRFSSTANSSTATPSLSECLARKSYNFPYSQRINISIY